MILLVPLPKVEKLKEAIGDVLDSERVCVTDLGRIVGYLISMAITLDPITRLFTRYMWFTIACRRSWRDQIVVSEILSRELRFWWQHVDTSMATAVGKNFPPLLSFLATLVRLVLGLIQP